MIETLEQPVFSSTMQLALMIGSGLLVIGLVVLAMTRWGQASPVWKCVILSCVAHILLVIYAYGTHLMFLPPIDLANSDDTLKISLIGDQDELLLTDSVPETILPDLDNDLEFDIFSQPLDAVDRPVIDSEIVIERVIPRVSDESQIDFQPQLPVLKSVPQATDVISQIVPELFDHPKPDELPKLESEEIQIDRKSVADTGKENSAETSAPLELTRPEMSAFQPIPSLSKPNHAEVGLDTELVDPGSSIPLATIDQLTPADSGGDKSEFQLPRATLESVNSFQRVGAPRRLADGKPMPEVYSLRSVENRFEIASQRGGSLETEQAVQAALNWLIESQEEDGRWDAARWGAGRETMVFGHDRKGAGSKSDSGITGLALLALLASGHTQLEGPYRESIQRALDYLIKQQRRDGDMAGEALLFARMYCHHMALLALSEALAMTGDQKLLSAVQRGVDYSLRAQNRQDGGWRYMPGDTGDMSQFGWVVLALHSARLGGAVIPEEAFDRMSRFIDLCASGTHGGLSAYRPGHKPSTAMTAEALVCRFVLQKEQPRPLLEEASRRMLRERPSSADVNLYYWYYGTLAMYHVGGADWQDWNEDLKRSLVNSQIRTGSLAGSWDPDCLWGGYGGRVYSTAMASLNLQVYYRYLPSLRISELDAHSETKKR